MDRKLPKSNQLSFSLIEVLIFITVLALFFVAAAAVTTVSLRNMKINEHKILATRYAEELLAWLQSQKDIDWDQFATHSTAPGTVYCFNDPLMPDNTPWLTGDCPTSLNGFYSRTVKIENDGSPPPILQTSVSINVQWLEPGNVPYSVPVNTVFSVWEK